MSAIRIQSKFNSSCKSCKGKVKSGDWVFYTPGVKGVVHLECPDPSTSVKPIKVDPQYVLGSDAEVPEFPTLFSHQREVVNTVRDGYNKLYLGWEMGTGKTLGSLASAHVADNFPLIIVCPAIGKINWQREAKLWLNKDAQVLSGRKPFEITSEVAVINYDVLDAWQEELIEFDANGIIFDESHYIKNPGSKRSIAAENIARTIDGLKFMLSGTPTPNSVHDLVHPLHILGVIPLFHNKTTFIKRYCPPIMTNYGVSHAKSRNLPELHENLKNACFIRKTKEECLDLPEKTRVDIPVEVKIGDSDEFYGPLLAQMKTGTITEARRVVRQNVTQQEAKGHIATARSEAGVAKISTMIEDSKNIDDPHVIMVHHKEVQKQLKIGLKKQNPVMLVGGMTDAKRQQAIDDFQDGKTNLIICSITAAGTGINLQRGQIMTMGELPLTYALLDQAESRCHRNGAQNALTVRRLIALNTFDETLLNIINRKQSVSAQVEDGLEVVSSSPVDIIAQRLFDLYNSSV